MCSDLAKRIDKQGWGCSCLHGERSRSFPRRHGFSSRERHLHQLFQQRSRSARRSRWPRVGKAPKYSSGCKSLICKGTTRTWLQLKCVGTLDAQHLRNSDSSFSALFKKLITHSTWGECKQCDHPPFSGQGGDKLPLQTAPFPAHHQLYNHLTLAPLQELKPSPSLCDCPFSQPVDVIIFHYLMKMVELLWALWLACSYPGWPVWEWGTLEFWLLFLPSYSTPSPFIKAGWIKWMKHHGECYHLPKDQDQSQHHSSQGCQVGPSILVSLFFYW